VANYPAALRDERDCLNCGEPFPPAKEGWQSLYCSMPCWRANNGGPGRKPPADPVPEILEQAVTKGPLHGGIIWPPTAPAPITPAPSRLIVVRVEPCPRCDAAHEVYGYPERTGG
jgi:hypothetical protein